MRVSIVCPRRGRRGRGGYFDFLKKIFDQNPHPCFENHGQNPHPYMGQTIKSLLSRQNPHPSFIIMDQNPQVQSKIVNQIPTFAPPPPLGQTIDRCITASKPRLKPRHIQCTLCYKTTLRPAKFGLIR